MSQPDVPVTDLLAMDSDSLTQEQLDTLFNTVETDEIIYNSVNSEDNPDFKFVLDPTGSGVPSGGSTPDFTEYNFGQSYTDYPSPGPSSPHPYPFQQQQCFRRIAAGPLPPHDRPQVLRSQTNTSWLAPSQPPPGCSRRPSLSQGDMDEIAAIHAQAPDPTFVRLMDPRHRSVTPDSASHRRRSGKHSRSKSRLSNGTRRQLQESAPTSVPYSVDGMVFMPLGVSPLPDELFSHHPTTQQQRLVQHGYADGNTEDQVLFRHMTGMEQIERSHKIIEIGAMAAIDPRLRNDDATIMKKLEEVEGYLKAERGGCEDALRGCASIREAVKGKMRMPGNNAAV